MSDARTTIAPEKWEQVEKIFDAVKSSPVGERNELVTQLCEGDTCLQSEVLRLLGAQEHGTQAAQIQSGQISPRSLRGQEAHSFKIGQLIAQRFEIWRFIGSGGMGEVYEAWDRELQQKVALKTILHDIATHPRIIERFKDEVRQSLRITHPNVCRIYQLASHEESGERPIWFLTMELLEGRTLADRLATEGPIPHVQASDLIRQMVAGLACAHQAGIVHRDLKPGNLMLVPLSAGSERLVITDFGLAISISSQQVVGSAGTPAYMAPEQAVGAEVGPQADIFALGLIICELLTGGRPVLDPHSAKLCANNVNHWLACHPNVPRQLRPIIKRCLRLFPEERFPEALRIASLLDKRRPTRTERAITGGVVVVALIALGLMLLPKLRDQVVNEVQLTPNNAVSGEPSLSADGKYLAYMSNRTNSGDLDIWFQALPAVGPRRLTTLPGERRTPSVSPDGKLVAFRSERDGGGIYLIGSDGKGERLLIPEGRNPSFSPDGNSLAYWRGSEDTHVSGEIYVISLNSGKSRRLAADFADARYPTWDGVGRLLFLGCPTTTSGEGSCTDWWTIDPDGNKAGVTGVLALLRSHHIEPVFPPQIAWQRGHILISGRQGQTFHIWDILTSSDTGRAFGRPLQISFGEHDEMALATANNGTLAVEHVTGALHLWRIGVGQTTSQSGKLTDSVELDCCPGVSGNGQTLFFARKFGDFRQLMRLDLTSGKESILFASDRDKLWPLPDSKGRMVAFESRSGVHPSISLWTKDGVRTLCNDCSHPSSWIPDGTQLIYTTGGGDIASLDIATGRSETIVAAGAGRVLSNPDYNVKNGYLLFTVTTGSEKQVFAARWPQQGTRPLGKWVPVTSTNETASLARWSPDGTKLFYLSQRDGYYCLWGNSFDPSRESVGRSYPVKHYHNLGISPSRTFPDLLGMSVANDWIYINPGESTSTIWQGRFRRHALWSFIRNIFHY